MRNDPARRRPARVDRRRGRGGDEHPPSAPRPPRREDLAGIVSPPGAARPATDVSRFELALNGQAVRNRHSIDDGAYGGETFIVWEEARQSLVYFYFTTAGFYTTGTMKVKDGVLTSHETVKGSAGGISEVEATHRLLPDGRLHVKSRYLKNGRWEDGRETYYVEDATAVVRFKE